ncbi:hypothetical protein DAPK24_044270 [Pichia kluyveri]|uniref:Mediator of RNA polymerase II transcription subunit 22 n=1 Tax=Pichia kluyveri TaxID=36015 RepID=A0AAV5R8D7_PICKL|nr:hypothetical protein DAPK24_044270 [Pichia kluyveri]
MSEYSGKFDANIQQIVTKFNETLELLKLNNKSIEVQAVESIQIQSNTQTIIRLITELLELTKTLKEKWVLGQVYPMDDDLLKDQEKSVKLYNEINNLLERIVQ